MILQLVLKNFRNFSSKTLVFSKEPHCIIGENGTGKTNILEAISLLSGKNMLGLEMQDLVKEDEAGFFIEAVFESGKIVSLAYETEGQKKQYSLGHKKSSLQKIKETVIPSVSFQPIDMNIMYLSPGLRRDFLYSILENSYKQYAPLYKKYKLVLKNRNSLLKSIGEGKSQAQDILFWNTQFIQIATKLYEQIFELVQFFEEHIHEQVTQYFFGKIHKVSFQYITKVDKKDISGSIQAYLEKNFQRDIILGSTHIGPHVDDFDILLDNKPITSFASRGETKSVIIGLKILETKFIASHTGYAPIILIDDFLSEIDTKHRNILFENFYSSQIIITSISELNFDKNIYL